MACLAGGHVILIRQETKGLIVSRSVHLSLKTTPTAFVGKESNKIFGSSFSRAFSSNRAHIASCIVAAKNVDVDPAVSEDQLRVPPSLNGDLCTSNPNQDAGISTGNQYVENGDGIATIQLSSSKYTNPKEMSTHLSSEDSTVKPKISNFQENGMVIAGSKVSSYSSCGSDRGQSSKGFENSPTFSSPLAMKSLQLMEKVDQNGDVSTSSMSTPKLDVTTPSPTSMEPEGQILGHTELPPVFDDNEATFAHLLASKNIIQFISRFPAWADAQKESGMPQRQMRAFYSRDDWLRHRSSLRYVRHVLSSVSSRVIVSLVPPVFTFTAGAVGVAAYNTALAFKLLPSFFPLLHAASLPYELTAPALALLLVFRTDASYSRYDEARKTWTSVISTTKELARQCAQMIKSPHDSALKSSLLSYIMAFPVALKCHLIHASDIKGDLHALLQDDDLAFVLQSQHKPNCLIQLISQTLGHLQLETTDRALLEANVTQFSASVSVCERLIRTPIPLSYTRLTSRFLVLWHISLPIVLWDSCNWLAVPATFFSAATLFCIEEVGVLIEEPFPMLALDKIIGVAHDNIWEWLKRQQQTDDFLASKVRENS